MNVIEGLQYVIIRKFSYGWPDLNDLRIQLPKQLNVKGGCNIGLLRNHHVLKRFDRVYDFITVMSKSVYYINAKDGYSYQEVAGIQGGDEVENELVQLDNNHNPIHRASDKYKYMMEIVTPNYSNDNSGEQSESSIEDSVKNSLAIIDVSLAIGDPV
ncbi:hypothetical protein BC332_07241 [Capsicum chinense]|nr:hypothetical protein BC332_07241 [Capsicum chinense]